MLKTLLATALLALPVLLPAAPPHTAKQSAATPAAASSAAATPAVSDPLVALDTSQGRIVLRLLPDKAPKSVANFLQYVRSGFYDGTTFHRVIGGYLIQGGLYTDQLKAKRTRPPVPAEANNGLSNVRGTIAVARGAAPDSGTSQFFINLVDNRRLDYVNDQSGLTWGYTVFGSVIKGMQVVDKIGKLPTHAQGPFAGDVPQPLVTIDSAKVIGAAPASASTAAAAALAAKAGPDSKKDTSDASGKSTPAAGHPRTPGA